MWFNPHTDLAVQLRRVVQQPCGRSHAVLALKVRLQPLPTSVVVSVYMRRAQSSCCDPGHVVGLEHESQSVGLQLLGLFIRLLDGLLIRACIWPMRCHAQMQASTCMR